MKRMHLNGFKFAGVGHTAIGLWRHPDNQAHRYKSLEYWTETAKTLEAGKFDSLFIADFLGIADVYAGSADMSFIQALGVPVDDPLMAVSAMAAVTKHLGFGVTVSTTYEQPYSFARKMTTLDHLTNGRIGWNIVTSTRESAARNLGLEKQIPHDERYDIADEFMSVAYKLWEGSWEEDAVTMDRQAGIFADPSKIHQIRHAGKYFRVPDAYLCEPSVQRTPVLFQAGASSRGKQFAAKHAEAVFLVDPNPAGMRKLVEEVRNLACDNGRDPTSIKFMAGISVIVAPTDAEAQAKFKDQVNYVSLEGTLARQSSQMNLDFSQMDIDKPLEYVETDGLRGFLERFTKRDPSRVWTPRQIAQSLASNLGGLTVVGSPAAVCDKLEEYMEATGIDGFNIADPMPLRTFPDFVNMVVPELQRRNRVWKDYTGSTFRESIGEPGQVRLRDDHAGAAYRPVQAPAQERATA